MSVALSHAAAALRITPDEVPDRVEAMAKELRQAKKLSAAGAKSEGVGVDALLAGAKKLGGVNVVVAEVAGGPQVLRQLIDQLRRKAAPIAVMLGARQDEGKVMLVAGLSRELVDRGLDAVAWVRAAAALVGGSGGGRSDMAQAGGKTPEKLCRGPRTRPGRRSKNCWEDEGGSESSVFHPSGPDRYSSIVSTTNIIKIPNKMAATIKPVRMPIPAAPQRDAGYPPKFRWASTAGPCSDLAR